ncbi:hypothetical protein GCM10010329_01640 [Streptomyces spiroverticillatus]|uniref:Integral membrane protein n=1 Tax=Streptomyces finlayi TaxID=67296 RepID=A0A918WS49_9ACTN|nr:hypothetical protein [Streptomyces finlayi]GGZ85694.1 hypothetical protein GCM10010329_01640 [Streptomyces spiroverticillatus]GHC77297.1 hypothetical protein GCM10010334_01630 [Streptomyces finlayi]
MILEALGSVILGLALAWAAVSRLPERLPSRPLVLTAGIFGALFGAWLTHAAVGPGHPFATLVGAATVGAVSLSLLLRPAGRIRRRSAAA